MKKLFPIIFLIVCMSLSADPTDPALAPSPLPSSTDMTVSYENAFMRMFVTLAGLLFLVFATFWVLRRMNRGQFKKVGTGRLINVIEKRPLSPKSMLYVVEVDNKRILVAESQVEVRALSSCDKNL